MSLLCLSNLFFDISSGVVMKDLIAIDVSFPNYIEHNGAKLINFHKMVKVANTLEYVLRSRHFVPNVSPKKEIFNVMRLSLRTRYSEDDLYEMSLQREPRTPVGFKLSIGQCCKTVIKLVNQT